MEFIAVSSITPVAGAVAQTIFEHAADGPVLWLVSGGSCVPVAIAAARQLVATRADLSGVTISLVDERFGPPGHADSNWTQLMTAGFAAAGAQRRAVLRPGLSGPATAADWEGWLAPQLETSYSVALLGIGPDGHTSGIKPASPALKATGLTCYYDWDDYPRLTTTAAALAKLSEGIVYAAGASKWPVLEQLGASPAPPANDLPAVLLSQLPKLTIYTDWPKAQS